MCERCDGLYFKRSSMNCEICHDFIKNHKKYPKSVLYICSICEHIENWELEYFKDWATLYINEWSCHNCFNSNHIKFYISIGNFNLEGAL
jgi:hypothetical protein